MIRSFEPHLVSSWAWNDDFDLEYTLQPYTETDVFNKFLWLNQCDNDFYYFIFDVSVGVAVVVFEMDTICGTRTECSRRPQIEEMEKKWTKDKNQWSRRKALLNE